MFNNKHVPMDFRARDFRERGRGGELGRDFRKRGREGEFSHWRRRTCAGEAESARAGVPAVSQVPAGVEAVGDFVPSSHFGAGSGLNSRVSGWVWAS